MKAREWLREWLPDIARIAVALLIVFAFLFQAATWITGSWKSGLLWAFLFFVTSGISIVILGKLSGYLSKIDWLEVLKIVLAVIGFLTVLYWLLALS
jgi:hypothetical protein